MSHSARPGRYRYEPDTPIADRLDHMTEGLTLATWNRHRSAGGEWDTLKYTPLRVRQRLASAGFLSKMGEFPDVFADVLARNGCTDTDPIGWYIREAQRALRERREAARIGRDINLARSTGYDTLFKRRDALARAAGHASYRAYRRSQGWSG